MVAVRWWLLQTEIGCLEKLRVRVSVAASELGAKPCRVRRPRGQLLARWAWGLEASRMRCGCGLGMRCSCSGESRSVGRLLDSIASELGELGCVGERAKRT